MRPGEGLDQRLTSEPGHPVKKEPHGTPLDSVSGNIGLGAR